MGSLGFLDDAAYDNGIHLSDLLLVSSSISMVYSNLSGVRPAVLVGRGDMGPVSKCRGTKPDAHTVKVFVGGADHSYLVWGF